MKGFLEMSEYNFVPDYVVSWKKRNLSKNDLIWLILGADPDHVKKYESLNGKSDKSQEEHSWYWAFYNRYDRKYPPARISDLGNLGLKAPGQKQRLVRPHPPKMR
jgi:hypothetical protein